MKRPVPDEQGDEEEDLPAKGAAPHGSGETAARQPSSSKQPRLLPPATEVKAKGPGPGLKAAPGSGVGASPTARKGPAAAGRGHGPGPKNAAGRGQGPGVRQPAPSSAPPATLDAAAPEVAPSTASIAASEPNVGSLLQSIESQMATLKAEMERAKMAAAAAATASCRTVVVSKLPLQANEGHLRAFFRCVVQRMCLFEGFGRSLFCERSSLDTLSSGSAAK